MTEAKNKRLVSEGRLDPKYILQVGDRIESNYSHERGCKGIVIAISKYQDDYATVQWDKDRHPLMREISVIPSYERARFYSLPLNRKATQEKPQGITDAQYKSKRYASDCISEIENRRWIDSRGFC